MKDTQVIGVLLIQVYDFSVGQVVITIGVIKQQKAIATESSNLNISIFLMSPE